MEEFSFSHEGLHFSALGMGSGPLVICLHGFPDCLHSFRHQMPALAAAGYHVVAPCLRGYEPSSQVADGHYPIPVMTTDVIADFFIEPLEDGTLRAVHDMLLGYTDAIELGKK